jgi:hypothetical protein
MYSTETHHRTPVQHTGTDQTQRQYSSTTPKPGAPLASELIERAAVTRSRIHHHHIHHPTSAPPITQFPASVRADPSPLTRVAHAPAAGVANTTTCTEVLRVDTQPTDSQQKTAISDPVLRDLQQVYDDLSLHRKEVTRLMASVKRCFTRVEKRLEQQNPQHKKGKGRGGGGLAKPFPVSPNLCTFMEVPHGTQLARAEVTKYLHKYIRDNDLYDQNNRQFIIPDDSLQTLFDIPDNSPMNIFSIQDKVNVHFQYAKSKSKQTTQVESCSVATASSSKKTSTPTSSPAMDV